MTLPKRTLTVNFQRSVTAGQADLLEVTVTPPAEPSAPSQSSLVGFSTTQVVVLADESNAVEFELVPTDHPGLTERVLYRIAWRHRYLGRQYVKDFVMPDFDVAFEDLEELGNVIGGETYVQWSDLDSLPRKVNVAVVPTTGADATVTHNLGTDDLIAVFRDSNTDESVVPVSWAPIGSNTLTVTFETAPTTGQYRAIVIG